MPTDAKTVLVTYLDAARDTVLWKLQGLSEHDLRRPMTPTGTNLLGLLKHLAIVESGYFGVTFGRPFPEHVPGYAESDPVNIDMYATAEESEADIRALWSRVRSHSDATIAALDLTSRGAVPWWGPDRAPVTLQRILVHEIAEWNRHGGQIDILREFIDGSVGYREGNTNLPPGDEIDWPAYVSELQRIADSVT